MKQVLFICNHNSARSQMAEALLKQTCGEFFEGAAAGMMPGTLRESRTAPAETQLAPLDPPGSGASAAEGRRAQRCCA